MIKKVKKTAPFIILLLISIYSLYPLLKSPLDTIIAAHEDLLVVWIINQTISKIPHQILNIFQANILYPHKNVLAFSDLLIPQAFINYLPVQIIKEPIISFNISLFLGQFISLIAVYLLWVDITKSKMSSLIASIALGLSTIRFNYQVHLQTWIIYWWIIAIWMLWKFVDKKNVKYLYISSIFTIIQTWESLMPVMWIAFTGLIISSLNIKIVKKSLVHIIIVCVIILICTSPVLNAYLTVSNQYGYVRSIRETAHFSMSIDDLWKINISPGLYALAISSFIIILKNIKKLDEKFNWIIILFVVGLIMSLGPVLKWNNQTLRLFNLPMPLPYAFTYYILPGIKAFRSPSRWILVAAFAASGLIAYSFKYFEDKKSKLILLIALATSILGGERITKVVRIEKTQQYPAVYKFIKNESKKVILELPIYTWSIDRGPNIEMKRMLYSLYHGKQLINGYTGYFPEVWTDFAIDLRNNFPTEESNDKLKTNGVDYVIVHKNEYNNERLHDIIKWGEDKLLWEDKDTLVYQL